MDDGWFASKAKAATLYAAKRAAPSGKRSPALCHRADDPPGGAIG
jgi:hypothetical protein